MPTGKAPWSKDACSIGSRVPCARAFVVIVARAMQVRSSSSCQPLERGAKVSAAFTPLPYRCAASWAAQLAHLLGDPACSRAQAAARAFMEARCHQESVRWHWLIFSQCISRSAGVQPLYASVSTDAAHYAGALPAACACMQVKSKAEKLKLSINFLGRKDHLDPVIQDYQVSAGAFT